MHLAHRFLGEYYVSMVVLSHKAGTEATNMANKQDTVLFQQVDEFIRLR